MNIQRLNPMLLVALLLPTLALAAESNPKIEVENPPGSGRFEPLQSAIVPSLRPTVRITLPPGAPSGFQLRLWGPLATVEPRRIDDLFPDLAIKRTATAKLEVLPGQNTIVFSTGPGSPFTAVLPPPVPPPEAPDAGTPDAGRGSAPDAGDASTPYGADAGVSGAAPRATVTFALDTRQASTATMLNFDKGTLAVDPREILPLVRDPGTGGLVEKDTVVVVFSPRARLQEISAALRAQHLEIAGFNLVTHTVRARITDGRPPSAVAKAIKRGGIILGAAPNPAAMPDSLGETIPATLRNTYHDSAGAHCQGAGELHGCFEHDPANPLSVLRTFRQHWLMDTFAAHRLVDRIVGNNPRVRPALADVDTGFGNGANPTDIPIDGTGLYGFSFAPFVWGAGGVQTNAGAITIANVVDTHNPPAGHGTPVIAAAASRGTATLGVGKDLRVRPIRFTGAGAGTWADFASGLFGACLDPAVAVASLQVGNGVGSYHAAGTPPNPAADLAAHNADAPNIRLILQPTMAFCRQPFFDWGRDGIPFTFDQGENDGVWEPGEPFVDTNGNGRYDNDQDGKILATSLGNDGMNLDATEMPSAFVPLDRNAPNAAFMFGVAATETPDPDDHVREPEQLAGFSNYGPRTSVCALGEGVVVPQMNGALGTTSGTSIANPIASGLMGEMVFLDRNQTAHPPLGPRALIEILEATAEQYGTATPAPPPNTAHPNDRPGHPSDAPDIAFGFGRINAWKALLSVANGGLAPESHTMGAGGRLAQFGGVATISEAATRWYGFKVYSPVKDATVWLDGVQLTDPGSTAPGAPNVQAYAGIRSDLFVRLGIDQNHDGVLDEDPTRGIMPLGNERGQYVLKFSAERGDLVRGGQTPRTLSLRKPGQTAADPPFFNLVLDLKPMRDGVVPGVVFDDFVFEITPPDFGDAPDRGGKTVARGEQGYPTALLSQGARHLNSNLEWFGREPNTDSVTPEHDAIDGVPRRVPDPDGVNNIIRIGDGPQKADLDRFDDGVKFFPLTYVPGQQGKVEFTLCVADQHWGRYTGDFNESLYVNGWIDWNARDGFEETGGEHVVDSVQINPQGHWSVLGHGTPTRLLTPRDQWGRCATFESTFPVPEVAKGPLWARFRVDYGENVGRNNPLQHGTGFQSDPTLRLSEGAARYGEVEDYLIGADFGDAPDPGYPTRKASDGARHLDLNREWLGKPDPKGNASATRETDGCDLTSAEEDGVPNLAPGCKGSYQDKKDDGASVPAVVVPGSTINVELDVSAKIDAFGFSNHGPAGQSSKGVMTLKPDCKLGPIAAAPQTPGVHADRGRYAAWDPRRRLYLNVWADWNGNGVWEASEKVISGPLDPEDWGTDGHYTLGEPFVDDNHDGVHNESEAFTDVAGAMTRHLSCQVKVPKSVKEGTPYAWRVRLDYGEDGVTHDEVIHHSTEDGRALHQAGGGALWGEVEDYPQCAKELDEFIDTTAEVTVEGPFGAERIKLTGPTTVVADVCHVTDEDHNGREEIATEMVSMELHGASLAGPVAVRIRDATKHPYQRSLGRIEEQVNATPNVLDLPPFAPRGLADSEFDVYVEAEFAGRKLHSHAPKPMRAVISHKPPKETYRNPEVIELFTEDEKPSGFRIGGASHTPGQDERLCHEKPGGQFLLEAQAGLSLTQLPLTVGATLGYSVTPDGNGYALFSPSIGVGAGFGLILPVGFQYELPLPGIPGLWLAPRALLGYSLELFDRTAFQELVFIPEVELKYRMCGGFHVGLVPLSFPTYIGGGGVNSTVRILATGGLSF